MMNPHLQTGDRPSLISTRNVSKEFRQSAGLFSTLLQRLGVGTSPAVVQAVTGVEIDIVEGEVLGLVGESGCGKSTLGRLICSVYSPTSGNIQYRGRDLRESPRLGIQMIFQDPHASLNPRKQVAEIVGQAPLIHGLVGHAELRDYVAGLLARVGLDRGTMKRYPHQLSGGQRQRVGIARALAVKPDLLVCDEAVSALDVSIQAQILNLFTELRESLNLTYLFISHDLGVIRHICDRVAVMYLGKIVEIADTERLFQAPNHPYTQSLLENLPSIKRRGHTFLPIKGEIPSPIDVPGGCAFHPRCPFAMNRCGEQTPALNIIAPGQSAACHLNDNNASRGPGRNRLLRRSCQTD